MTSAKKILAISAIAGMALASLAATKNLRKDANARTEDCKNRPIYPDTPQHSRRKATLKKGPPIFLPHIKFLAWTVFISAPVAEADRDEKRELLEQNAKRPPA